MLRQNVIMLGHDVNVSVLGRVIVSVLLRQGENVGMLWQGENVRMLWQGENVGNAGVG